MHFVSGIRGGDLKPEQRARLGPGPERRLPLHREVPGPHGPDEQAENSNRPGKGKEMMGSV